MAIPKKESDKAEFKPVLNNAVIEALVAFSNAKGGTVYVGVADNSKVTGVQLAPETLPQFLNEVKNKTIPSIIPDADIIDAGKDKKVVALSVPEYPIKPVSFQGRYYKRVNASNHLLTANEVANIHLQTMNTSWDFYPHPKKTIADISLEKVRKVMNIIKKRNSGFQIESEIEFLEKNEMLLPDKRVTNGCFLMFLKDEHVSTTIHMGHFASEIVIKDDVVNSSDILTQIDDVMDFIRKHISKALIITDTQVANIQRWDYPLDGLRELALNMIIHRDYMAPGHSIIKIFPDRIQLFNPGTLPDTITVEQLQTNRYVSTPRNRQIAKLVKEMGLVEHYGTGIKKVQKMFADHGLTYPTFNIISGGLSVTVYKEEGQGEGGDIGGDIGGEKGGDNGGDNGTVNGAQNGTVLADAAEMAAEKGTVKGTEEIDLESGMKNGMKNGMNGESSEKSTKSSEKSAEMSEKSTEMSEKSTEMSEKSAEMSEKSTEMSEKSAEMSEKSTEMSEKILEIINDNPHITIEELSAILQKTTRTVERNLKILKSKGLIQRIGPDRGGHWRVIR